MKWLNYLKSWKNDREVKDAFRQIRYTHQAKELVDKAISYRTLDRYDRAIALLEKSLRMYPRYTPAKVVLGNTLRQMGKIDEAEAYFRHILAEHVDGKDMCLTEVYANLGAIYYFDRGDVVSARRYYEQGLSAPQCQMIEDEGHKIAISNIHKDLCFMYACEKRWHEAKEFARRRLTLNSTCPVAAEVLAVCSWNEYSQDEDRSKYQKREHQMP